MWTWSGWISTTCTSSSHLDSSCHRWGRCGPGQDASPPRAPPALFAPRIRSCNPESGSWTWREADVSKLFYAKSKHWKFCKKSPDANVWLTNMTYPVHNLLKKLLLDRVILAFIHCQVFLIKGHLLYKNKIQKVLDLVQRHITLLFLVFIRSSSIKCLYKTT